MRLALGKAYPAVPQQLVEWANAQSVHRLIERIATLERENARLRDELRKKESA